MPPRALAVSATQAAIEASSDTSVAMKRLPAWRWATCGPLVVSMSAMTTWQPSATRAATTPSPIMVAPPVTMATLFFMLMKVSLHRFRGRET